VIAFGPTIARLKLAGFAYVEGLLEMAALDQGPRQTPALFIVPQRDSARPNTLGAGGVDQRVADTFSVVLVIEAPVRNQGAASEALVDACIRIEQALVGWQHPGASGICEYAGGALISLDGLRITWKLEFTIPRRIRKV